ncbi:MAG TPA: amidohydrolase family protein [Burkholderiaceae bacterium]
MHIKHVFLSVLLAWTCTAQAGDLTRYTIFSPTGSKQVGEEVVARHGQRLTVKSGYKNNGRGPDIDERIDLAADGSFSRYEVKGRSMMGSAIDELYTRNGRHAVWRSTSEQGKQEVDGTAQYVPLFGSFTSTAQHTVALLKRPDGKLPLLPSGTLTQRKLDTLRLSAGGKTRTVELYAQTGLGLEPAFVWVSKGREPKLFAQIFPAYLGMVEEGWMPVKDTLIAHQNAAQAKLLKDMAQQLQPALQGLTAIRNARVFDSEHATLGQASDVYILRGRITSVVPAGTGVVPAQTEIDAAGRVLVPGLFDMHVHLARWDGGLHLAAGVTTVRDMGNTNTQLQQIVAETAEGALLGPQVVAAGFLEGESPHSANLGFVVKELDAAKKAIDWYAANGYVQLKIYNSFPYAILRDTIAYAHQRGLRVSGHVPVHLRAQDAVEQGYDELQHINQVMLNFFVKPETDTRTLERFYLPARKGAALNLDSPEVQSFFTLLKARKVAVDPTLATFDFLRQRDGTISRPFSAVADHVPADVRRGLYIGGLEIPDDATHKQFEASYDKMVEFVGRLYRAGVPLVAGTDATAGFALHAELELYVKAGLTPAQALQVATWNGARYSGVLHERGSIAPGKLADLVLVDGDPTVTIGDLRRAALVLTRGRMIVPAKVHQALGIKPFTDWKPAVQAQSAN